MASGEWREFVDIVSSKILVHPDLFFDDTVALALGDDVYAKYRRWKSTLEGTQAAPEIKVKYLLDTWKTNQSNQSTDFLITCFIGILSSKHGTAELTEAVQQRFREGNF